MAIEASNSVNVMITARNESVGKPWLWEVSRNFNVVVNIVRANIDTDLGIAEVELRGTNEDIQRAIAWLMTTGLHVESQSRALGA